MKKKTTKRDEDFLGDLSEKIMKSHKLDGIIIIANKGHNFGLDIAIEGTYTPLYLRTLSKASEQIKLSFVTQIIKGISTKPKKKATKK